MHSKMNFFKLMGLNANDILQNSNVVFIASSEVIFHKYFKESIKKQIPELILKSGQDLTVEWMENNFWGLSLFAQNEIYWITNAELMNASVKRYLQTKDFSAMTTKCFFQFNQTLAKEMTKNNSLSSYEIESFKYFDFSKFLDYLSDKESVYLSFEAKNYFNQTINQTVQDYYQAITKIKINLEDKRQVEVKDIEGLYPSPRFDQFQLLNLLTQKKFRHFFEKLIELELEADTLFRFCTFVQGHFLKVYDPSYLDKKESLTNFDKQIKFARKDWKEDEIRKVVAFFAQLELISKTQKNGCQDYLRSAWIKTFV